MYLKVDLSDEVTQVQLNSQHALGQGELGSSSSTSPLHDSLPIILFLPLQPQFLTLALQVGPEGVEVTRGNGQTLRVLHTYTQ